MDEAHRKEGATGGVGAGVVDGDDARVVEAGGHPGLAGEAALEGGGVGGVGWDVLFCDLTAEAGVEDSRHAAHAAAGDEGLAGVTDGLGGGEGVRGLGG